MPNKPKPTKPRRAYALATPRGAIDIDSIRLKAKDAKWSHRCGGYGPTWKGLHAAGYRCVRVVIKEDCDAM